MSRSFRFGVVTGGSAQSQRAWVTLARRAEEPGHATPLMPDRPSLGGLALQTALAVAAEAATALRVGSCVFCSDYRRPAILAKEAATQDPLSDGRFESGLGAGVSPVDYTQMGLAFESASARISRLEEALHSMKGLFTQEVVNFSGIIALWAARASHAPATAPPTHLHWQRRQKAALDCRPTGRQQRAHAQNDTPGS